MKILWNILLATLVPAYLVGAGVLMHFGYNTYFGIPSEYINTSPSFYAIFALNIYTIVVAIISSVTWWQWPLFLLGFGLVWLIFVSGRIGRTVVFVGVGILLVKLLFGMIYVGDIIAKTQTSFLVPSADCTNLGDSKYVIPVMRGNDAVLIPVDDNRVMKGTFIVKNVIELNCPLSYELGKPVQK